MNMKITLYEGNKRLIRLQVMLAKIARHHQRPGWRFEHARRLEKARLEHLTVKREKT